LSDTPAAGADLVHADRLHARLVEQSLRCVEYLHLRLLRL
jgi:hypothetical protein